MKKRLENILNSKVFILVLLVVVSIFIWLSFSIKRTSKYSIDDTIFKGTLDKLTISDTKVVFNIQSEDENLICNYYLKEGVKYDDFYSKYKLGMTIQLSGNLSIPLNNTVPNTFNYKDYLYNHKTYYTCVIDDIEVVDENINLFYKIKNFVILRIMKYDIKDYLYTMIIGDKSLLDDETFDKYRQNGVTHLFAISGMHVGLFSAFLLKLFKRLGEKKKYFIVITFIWFYAFLAGFTPSVVRSCLLFSLLTMFKMLKIEVSSLNVLILTGFILILNNYLIIKDIGFIYSFVTTFGLIYSKDILSKHKIIGTSLVASLYSLPITINNFYKFNLLSVIFNLIFVPLVSIVIYPLCLISFIFPFLEPITKIGITVLEALNNLSASIDFLYFVVPKMNIVLLILYYVLLIVFLKKKFYIVSIFLFSIILINKMQPFLDTSSHVEFLDVGQGDSTLIRTNRNREVILIDTGGKETFGSSTSNYHVASNTVTYLNSLGIDSIDLLILTHGDADHLGDALYLIENMNVKSVMLNGGELNSKEKAILDSGVNVVDQYDGTLELEFLNDKDWNDENANSIVTSFSILDNHFMIMGDASKEVEKYILSSKKFEDIDVLKLGHHGSKTSSDREFLEKTNVGMGIISCGRNNKYGHPSKETLDTLKSLNIPYKNTQVDGTISLKIDFRGVTYSTFPP